MLWLENLDADLFRWINLKWDNPVSHWLMPFLSGNAFFLPVLIFLAILLIAKGGKRGLICVVMLSIVLSVGDGVICRTLKEVIGRPRPFIVITEAIVLVGKSGSGSMPSSHAANWFSATMVALVYYRRSLWFMLPCALLVSLSRICNGVHYPSDVIAGAILGAGYACAIMVLLNWIWTAVGRRWFPLWWERLPSLLSPTVAVRGPDEETELDPDSMPTTKGIAPAGFRAPHLNLDAHWLNLGYLLVAVLFIARLLYLRTGAIQLAEDEAYQWLWSKHLALSYYSKPPLIAYTQFLGTHLWGDTAFGVRFFSPVLAAGLSICLLRFFAREFNARAGFFLILILTATPLAALGSILMTVDPLSVFFWTLAMISGWRAVQERSTTGQWMFTGLWMGLGFLSKYTAVLQILCWVVFFFLSAPARRQLRRPGPYLALLVMAICAAPVLIWNGQHDWVTVTHVADDAGAHEPWQPTLRYVGEFLGSEFGLLNPFFFVAMIWAAIAFWGKGRRNPKLLYLFSMGAPVFLAFFLHSFKSRVMANWIAPSIVPLFCLMVAYWDTRWRLAAGQGQSVRGYRLLLTSGIVFGMVLVLAGHNTDVIRKVAGRYLPLRLDPLHRVRRWTATAQAVGAARQELAKEGKPVFIIANHYGMAGQISFYLPQAKEAIEAAQTPLVYCRSSAVAENQFHFWPGYGELKGQSAVYVIELDRNDPKPAPVPVRLAQEFQSVQLLMFTNIEYHGEVLRPLQILACRNLK